MTQQLIEIIERVKSWPDWRQDNAAYLLEIMEDSGTRLYRLSDEERLERFAKDLRAMSSPTRQSKRFAIATGHEGTLQGVRTPRH